MQFVMILAQEPDLFLWEMALRASEGEVYAIEKKEDALALLAQNKKKFALDHMYLIPGTAPEALEERRFPTHAFIRRFFRKYERDR